MSKTAEPSVAEKMQQGLADAIVPLLDTVRQERSRYYADHPAPDRTAVPTIISSYSNMCGSIAVACNLVPGPWGLIAIIPEITLVLQQQLKMVYDIARAYGHSDQTITKELLLGVVLSGAGTGTGGLIVIQGGKVIVKRASLRLIQKLVAALGGKITQKVLKSMLARWVPIAGAAALGLWARYSTNRLGQQAKEIFGKEVVLEDVVVDEGEGPGTEASSAQEGPTLDVERIRLMVAMTWLDRKADSRELEFVAKLLEDPELSPERRDELRTSMETGKVAAVDYKAFEGREDEKIATLMDMIALMKIDEHEHVAERLFIRKVGKEFGFSEVDVDEMMAA